MIKETLYNLRRHPIVTGVTIIGTALSIFLIMVLVMMQQVKVAPFAPESNRDRMLHYRYISFSNKNWDGTSSNNGSMSWDVVKNLFYTFDGAEAVTGYSSGCDVKSVGIKGEKPFAVDVRETDAAYFDVFDFGFVSGRPFSREEFEAGMAVAVIDSNVARSLFGSDDVEGRYFSLNGGDYRVSGVVKPVSPLASNAYGQIWINTLSTDTPVNSVWAIIGGAYSVTMLVPEGEEINDVHADFDRHFEAYNKSIEKSGWFIISHNRPYTQEKNVVGEWANFEPDVDAYHRSNMIVYAILLLVPAINLSSMTHSRLRQRVGEIAVRRAFGATRRTVFMDIINENLCVTLIGGVIGLALSVVAALCFENLFFAVSFAGPLNGIRLSPSMLLQWSTFAWALLFCFVLNILSAGIPAMQMSRIGLVNSLRGGANK